MAKISSVSLSRSNDGDVTVWVHRSNSKDCMWFWAKSPARTTRIMNFFLAWLVGCGEKLPPPYVPENLPF
jgi:hypothetical protein